MKKLLLAMGIVLMLCQPAMAGTNYNVRFNSLDADLDGLMSKSEFMVAFSGGDMAIFETADTNKDGDVTLDEWEAYKKSQGFEQLR